MKHDGAGPKYWRYESSGILAPVVEAYILGQRLTAPQIKIMQAYLWQWIQSEVWQPSGELEVLRLRVAAIETQADIDAAIDVADELGIDPL